MVKRVLLDNYIDKYLIKCYSLPFTIINEMMYCASHKKWQCFTVIQDQRIVENRRHRGIYNHT